MELDTVALILEAWYRLVGSKTGDQDLEEQNEDADEIGYLNLTRGCRRAQRWMIRMGFGGWRKRTSALSFTGSDSADGGRHVTTMPSDFLRAYGNMRRSALVEADGDRWGTEITDDDRHLRGDHYYMKGGVLWLARTANIPTTLYLDYHYTHPKWESGVTIDFPMEARYLIVTEAAQSASQDNWYPGGEEERANIAAALRDARTEARYIARPTKQPRQFKKPFRFANRW